MESLSELCQALVKVIADPFPETWDDEREELIPRQLTYTEMIESVEHHLGRRLSDQEAQAVYYGWHHKNLVQIR